MMWMLSLWLSVFYVLCCHLQVTSGSDVFLVKVVSSQRVCDRLCVYTSRCKGYRWDALNRACHLSSQPSSTDPDFTNVTPHNGQCGQRQCAKTDTCVPVESATAYICLGTSSTSSTSSPVTTAAVNTPPGYKGCYRLPFPPDERLERRNMTTDMCRIHCTQKKYSLFGLRDGGECLCGNGGIMCAYRVSETECNVTCAGDNTKMCGGTEMMAIYQITSEETQETNTSEKETTTSKQTHDEYKGCYSDAWPPDLPDECLERKNMTTDMCGIHCTQKGYSVFGLKEGGKCFCDNSNIMSGYSKTSETECNIPCTGDNTKTCGGTERMAIYQVV